MLKWYNITYSIKKKKPERLSRCKICLQPAPKLHRRLLPRNTHTRREHIPSSLPQSPRPLLHLLLSSETETRSEPNLTLLETVLPSVRSEDRRGREDDEVGDERVEEGLTELGWREEEVVGELDEEEHTAWEEGKREEEARRVSVEFCLLAERGRERME